MRNLWIRCGTWVVFLAAAARAHGGIIAPTIVSEDLNTDVGIGANSQDMVNGAGLSAPLNTGDPLTAALNVTHTFGGSFQDSYVSVAAFPEYFAANGPASVVFDLTGGGDTPIRSALFWQYENNGGNNSNVGNHARTIELRFNTEAQGSGLFAGPVSTVTLEPVIGAGAINGMQSASVGGGGSFRYAELQLVDNHFGDPDGFGVSGGGDRIGLGEIRFATESLQDRPTLTINAATGAVLLRNPSVVPFDINYYEIRSSSGSLNPAQWSSLDQQNVDAVDGDDAGSVAGDSLLEGWDAAANNSASVVSEAFLFGSSTLDQQTQISLGRLFQSAGARDVTFHFATVDGTLLEGGVEYVEGRLGDYNGNSAVDAADYTVWKDSFGSVTELAADGNGNGVIDAADYTIWKDNFGASIDLAVSVPESSSALVLLSLVSIVGLLRPLRRI
ncbi:MAG: hypothetical protein R3E01_30605 [Pirellulaceae bacterium]|nr:hypothetical protein [Planctomycetales bacterium]